MTTNYYSFGALQYKNNCYYCLKELIHYYERVLQLLSVSSISVGISGFFATYSVYILLGMTPKLQICVAVFLMAFSVYSLNKITDIEEDSINMPIRISFIIGRKNVIITYSIIAYAVCILLVFMEKPTSTLITLFPLIANVLYGLKLLPGLPRLKNIPIMKNLIVAASWAITTTLLPYPNLIDRSFIGTLIIYFVFAKGLVNTVLYDMRDIDGDDKNDIKTIPILIGRVLTTKILLAINSTLLPILLVLNGSTKLFAGLLILNGFACILYFYNKTINTIAMDTFVDGEWMLVSLIFLLINKFGLPI